MIPRTFIFVTLFALSTLALVDGFSVPVKTFTRKSAKTRTTMIRPQRSTIQISFATSTSYLQLVTEKDVLDAVENAEKLWAKALEARKTANALCDKAEEEAEAAAELSETVAEEFQNMEVISLEKIAQADAATKTNIDANSMVSRAMKAADEADELEAQAEKALQMSEERLDQHLKDFPDSPLAE